MIVAGIHLLKLSKLYNGKAVYKKKKQNTKGKEKNEY